MRKLIAASVGIVALTMLAWSVMPAASAMAQALAKAPAPTLGQCFDTWLQCVEAAGQTAYCCEHPDANECAKTLKMAPDAAAKLPPELTCKGQFDEDLTECNTDFTACISSVAPAPPAKKQ